MSRLDDYTIADARGYGFGLLELYKLWHMNCCFPHTSFHNNIDEMAHAAQRELDERYQLLPLDADGEVIHIGDEMVVGDYRFIVDGVGLIDNTEVFFTTDRDKNECFPARLCRHYRLPLVEDVLREFAKKMHDASFVYDRVEDTQQRIVEEYAAKLQMREGQDEA